MPCGAFRLFRRDRYQETGPISFVGQLLFVLARGGNESRPEMGGLGCFLVRLFYELCDEVQLGDMEMKSVAGSEIIMGGDYQMLPSWKNIRRQGLLVIPTFHSHLPKSHITNTQFLHDSSLDS